MGSFRPPSFLIYGPTKTGKTTCVANALEPSTYYYFGFDADGIAVVTDPKTSKWLKHYNGDIYRATPEYGNFTDPRQPYREVDKRLDDVARRIAAGQLLGAVVDTATAFAERAKAAALGMYAEREAYGIPSSLAKRQMLRIVTSIQHAGGLLVIIAHEQGPSPDGKPGGPKLPGQLLEDLPGAVSVVLRMEQRAGIRPGETKRLLICDPDNRTYITANRYGTSPREEPADNLGDLIVRTWDRALLLDTARIRREAEGAKTGGNGFVNTASPQVAVVAPIPVAQ